MKGGKIIPNNWDNWTLDNDTHILDNEYLNNTSLSGNLLIPNTVTSIGDWAFNGCTGLTSITIPDSVTTIGQNAFDGCASLKRITLPTNSNFTSIGNSAFAKCSSLESVTIPISVITIGDNAFAKCSSLKSVTNPESVITIGDNAFSGCTELKTVETFKKLKKIGMRAFGTCVNMDSFEFKEGLIEIDNMAFSSCGLKEIVIPNTIKRIGNSAFIKCKELSKVTFKHIDEQITIEGDAFSECKDNFVIVNLPKKSILQKSSFPDNYKTE